MNQIVTFTEVHQNLISKEFTQFDKRSAFVHDNLLTQSLTAGERLTILVVYHDRMWYTSEERQPCHRYI